MKGDLCLYNMCVSVADGHTYVSGCFLFDMVGTCHQLARQPIIVNVWKVCCQVVPYETTWLTTWCSLQMCHTAGHVLH